MSFKLTIYNNDCLNLTKSLLLKSDLLAKDVEYLLTGNTTFLDRQRKTWKYYLNLSGQYHSTNTTMYITSLDTLTRIEFTLDVLSEHPVTVENYTPNGTLTKELMVAYPDNRLLIMGIIYGIDIDTCIDCPEYTILDYDKTLVGVQEINLIPELQTRLYTEYTSYVNKDYADIETYYGTVVMSFMAKQALVAIKIIRLSNYKTTRAADYYIWTYINSKLYLEDLRVNLTQGAIFYLYKNIDRLMKSVGSNAVLYELIEKFLTTDTITTFRLNYLKDTTGINELESELKVAYREVPIGVDVAVRDTDIIEYIEYGDSISNLPIDDYQDKLEKRIFDAADRTRTRELKVFELVKNATDTQILLIDIDVHVQAAMDGWFTQTLNINNHITGRVYSLTQREAIIFYTYIIRKRFGIATDVIPEHTIYITPKATRLSVPELATKYNISTTGANALLEALPVYPTEPLDREAMDAYIAEVKSTYHEVVRLVRQLTTRKNQAQLSLIYNELYLTGDVQLASDSVTYDDWLAVRGMEFDDFEFLDYGIMETYLLQEVFNIDLSTRTSQYSKAITEMVSRLNNYRVNLRLEAGSDNLIDYHISPIYNSTEVGLETQLDEAINLRLDNRASLLQEYPPITYNLLSTVNSDRLTESSGLTVRCGFKAMSTKSVVTTSMSSDYPTTIELRNSDV